MVFDTCVRSNYLGNFGTSWQQTLSISIVIAGQFPQNHHLLLLLLTTESSVHPCFCLSCLFPSLSQMLSSSSLVIKGSKRYGSTWCSIVIPVQFTPGCHQHDYPKRGFAIFRVEFLPNGNTNNTFTATSLVYTIYYVFDPI